MYMHGIMRTIHMTRMQISTGTIGTEGSPREPLDLEDSTDELHGDESAGTSGRLKGPLAPELR